MVEHYLSVTSRLGLHARAAAKLVRVAGEFQSSVKLQRRDGNVSADAKSILSVLMLAATRGTELRLIAEGPDEQEALDAVLALFMTEFGESEKVKVKGSPVNLKETRWKGLGVSEGIVIGRVLRLHNGSRTVYRARIDEADVRRELNRFRAAVGTARGQLQNIKQRAEKELGRGHAYIFDAHLLFLEDAQLIEEVEAHIVKERANAEWAVKVVGDRLLAVYSEIKDDYLRERGSDIEDVVQRLLVNLGGELPQYRTLLADSVIVAPDLLPSAVAELDLQRARAIATDTGGWTSHMAIIARGLGIPAVVGLRNFFRRTRTGDEVIVDSFRGEVILSPSAETLDHYRAEVETLGEHRSAAVTGERGPAETKDGVKITLRANVELAAEFEGIQKFGACGVGLYRSEFLLGTHGGMVSEDLQYQAYRQLAEVAGPDGAIVRLFDLGGSDSASTAVRNPALGLRAIRFNLCNEEVMRTQLRAVLKASESGRLDIVLPMVGDVGDVRRSREILEQERTQLKAQGIRPGPVKVGAMIEVPSAVLTAEKIARSVDFFELGTNDLVQYTLAVDRGNDDVSDWFRTLHPAVLYSIARSLTAAKDAGIPAIICGEMASTPAYAVLLIGLGAVDLSMTPSSIPLLRQVISQVDFYSANQIARKCLKFETAEEVEELVSKEMAKYWPALFPPESLPTIDGKT